MNYEFAFIAINILIAFVLVMITVLVMGKDQFLAGKFIGTVLLSVIPFVNLFVLMMYILEMHNESGKNSR